jgi:hypothetical protein
MIVAMHRLIYGLSFVMFLGLSLEVTILSCSIHESFHDGTANYAIVSLRGFLCGCGLMALSLGCLVVYLRMILGMWRDIRRGKSLWLSNSI